MPTKDEMVAFFKKYRTQEPEPSARVDTASQKVACDAAQAVAASVLTQVDRPTPLVPTRPSGPPTQSGRGRAQAASTPTVAAIPEEYMQHALPPPNPLLGKKVTLVLDVDETLVHSSFKPGGKCDLTLPLQVNGQHAQVHVRLRPHLTAFLDFVSTHFEVVVFTASLGLYCNPLMDTLDPSGRLGGLRLFREHCVRWNGAYVKDLRGLGRPLERVAIVDNSPAAYVFQPRNAIPVVSWFEDPEDHELRDLIPFLHRLASCDSVYEAIERHNAKLHP